MLFAVDHVLVFVVMSTPGAYRSRTMSPLCTTRRLMVICEICRCASRSNVKSAAASRALRSMVRRKALRFDPVAVGPGDLGGISGRWRHLENGQPLDVRECLLRPHQDTAESFPVYGAHHGRQPFPQFTDRDGFAFVVDSDLVRWGQGHAIHLQFRSVELIQRSIRDEQSIADEQRLHSGVDQRLIQLMVIVTGCCLLPVAGGGQNQKEEPGELPGIQFGPDEFFHARIFAGKARFAKRNAEDSDSRGGLPGQDGSGFT